MLCIGRQVGEGSGRRYLGVDTRARALRKALFGGGASVSTVFVAVAGREAGTGITFGCRATARVWAESSVIS